MIRKSWETRWLLTPQVEHARVSAIIAASWNFPGVKPHEEVLAAALHHDDAWKAVDEQPLVNPAGAPMAFDEIEFSRGSKIWRECAELLMRDEKYYAAKLVAGHFLHLQRQSDVSRMRPREVVEVGKLIGDLRGMQARCDAHLNKAEAHALNITEEDIDLVHSSNGSWSRRLNYEQDLRFLQVCDFISLLLCTDFTGEVEIDNVPYMQEGDRLQVVRKAPTQLAMTISPMPFRKNLRDHLTSVPVARRIYSTSEELTAEFNASKSLFQEFHIGSPADTGAKATATAF